MNPLHADTKAHSVQSIHKNNRHMPTRKNNTTDAHTHIHSSTHTTCHTTTLRLKPSVHTTCLQTPGSHMPVPSQLANVSCAVTRTDNSRSDVAPLRAITMLSWSAPLPKSTMGASLPLALVGLNHSANVSPAYCPKLCAGNCRYVPLVKGTQEPSLHCGAVASSLTP